MTPSALKRGKFVRKIASTVGRSMHPALGLVDETMEVIEGMELGADGSGVPLWIVLGTAFVGYLLLKRS